jgi:hypothetical protein
MKSATFHATGRNVLLVLILLASLATTVARAGAQSAPDTAYVSEQFGYRIDWQAPWFSIGSETGAEFDHLILSDGIATAHVIFSRPGDTPLSEIAGFLLEGPDNRSFTPGQLATDSTGKPIRGETADRAWVAWFGHLSSNLGADPTEFRYAEVRRLDDEIAVGLSVESSAASFDGSVERFSALLDGIGQPSVSPGAGPETARHARLVFDPQVTVQDQELITESVRLAEDFFVIRFAAPLGANVTVTALPISSPIDKGVIAATLGSSMVIYAGSIGWVESPPAERMRTVIHEYTHAYQFSKTADQPLESAAWFEEGVAEYLSMIALSDLGLASRTEQDAYFGAIVRHSELPALQELERFEVLRAQPGSVYPLAYLGVSHLMQDLPLTAIDEYYTALQQGTPFARAFELAYGVTPAEFYAGFARLREQDLPIGASLPAELEISDGIDLPSAVTAENPPVFVIPGQQAMVVAEAEPGANCTLDLTMAGSPAVIDDRATFTNGAGQVFWIVTIPADLPGGPGAFVLSCGADPLTLPVLVF